LRAQKGIKLQDSLSPNSSFGVGVSKCVSFSSFMRNFAVQREIKCKNINKKYAIFHEMCQSSHVFSVDRETVSLTA
jgi:hypothetical protein